MKVSHAIGLCFPMFLVCGSGWASGSKSFTPELMLQNQDIGEVRFSPDGSHIYMDKYLEYRSKQTFDRDRDWGRSLSQLSAIDMDTGKSTEVSQSAGDRTWYLASSPAGTYTAFGWLDNGIQRLGIFDPESGKSRRLPLAGTTSALPLLWLSENEFVTISMANELQGRMVAHDSYSVRKIAEWSQDTWDGNASVKVVGAGRYKSNPNENPVDLVAVDARSGQYKKVDAGTIGMVLSAAPRGDRVAYLRKIGSFDMTGIKLEAMSGAESIEELAIYDTDSGKTVVKTCQGCSVNDGSLRWSPEGGQLYYSARSREGDTFRYHHYVYNIKTGKSSSFQPVDLNWDTEIERSRFVAPILWLDESHFVLRTRNKDAGQFENQDFRWSLVDTNGKLLRELTADIPRGSSKEVLKLPVAVHKGALLIIADGDLWRVPKDGPSLNLTKNVGDKVDSWCTAYSPWRVFNPRCDALASDAIFPALDQRTLDKDQIPLRIMRDEAFSGEFLLLSLVDGQSTRLKRPTDDSEPLEVSALAKAAVFQRKGKDGDEVLLVREGRDPLSLYRFNNHLAGVQQAQPVLLTRREAGEDEDRNDWLLLPPSHKPGQRHPLLVYFYPDTQYRKELKGDDLRDISFLNKNIPAAHGYAVLMASMKISDYGKAGGNPMREMHAQLIRAAENAVAKGYVDPERWAIMGHSYGGYGTNSVISQTGRFKAAISMDGPSNLTSGYAIGMNQDKAYAVPEGLNFGALWSEGGQGRMGVAPWRDPQRYIDNSPLFWAHQITTPLMLIHGDQDFVNVNEAEQLFAALHREGKDVQLVRYWGEGHTYSSPGNIKDMWDRIFGFLDENLNRREASGNSGARPSAAGVDQ